MNRQSARPLLWRAHPAPLLAAAACAVLAAACSDQSDPRSSCGPYSYNAVATNSKYNLDYVHEAPDCPVFVPVGGEDRAYQAVMYADRNYATGQIVYTNYYDANGNLAPSSFAGAGFGIDPNKPNGRLRAQPNGSVFVGEVDPRVIVCQTDEAGNTECYSEIDDGEDTGVSYTQFSDGNTASAGISIDYHWPDSYAAQASPATIQPGQGVSLSVNPTQYNRATGPVTYQWYALDGTFLGSGPTLTYWPSSQAMGSVAVSVTITDANGRKGTYPTSFVVQGDCSQYAC